MQMVSQGKYLLTASEYGYGKLTEMEEFPLQRRGGKGVKCYKILDKTGDVVGAKALNLDKEIMIITNEGIVIRMSVQDISIVGRITSGVKLIDIAADKGIRVASITKVKEPTQAEVEAAEAEVREFE